jgi:F-type H+-transporting ATPase subunit c
LIYFAALVTVVGLAVPIAVLSAAMGQAKAVAAALESIGRQPEASGKIQAAMILGVAFIESLALFALVVALLLLTKLPDTKAILASLGAH